MTEIIPTEEQLACESAARNSSASLLVNALAGAAKTTTLVRMASALPVQPIICVAFNKRIATEMGQRMPGHVTCATLNSVGHRVWASSTGKRLKVDTDKTYNCLNEVTGRLSLSDRRSKLGDSFTSLLRAVRLCKSAGYVPESMTRFGQGLCSIEDLLETFARQLDIDPDDSFLEFVDKTLELSITQSYQGLIDFDDQIYMSCQPAGTLVEIKKKKSSETYKLPIEDVKAGMEVVSFNRQTSKFVGIYNHATEVTKVAQRLYSGTMFHIEAGSARTSATEEHKWLVRFKQDLKRQDLFFTYLMEKQGSFKIGTCQVKSVRPGCTDGFGLAVRCAQEKPDKAWILGVHTSRDEAMFWESAMVAEFGITDRCFTYDPIGDRVHEYQRSIYKMRERAIAVLQKWGRHIKYPFWIPNCTRAFSSNFITESCNLISEIMEVPIFSGGSAPNWQPLWVDWSEVKEVTVYSLKVEIHELYVADNILTHNCLFTAKDSHPRYPVVMVDEAQDLSPLNHKSLEKMYDGRLIAVGDPWQAIYGFRGASHSSMAELKAHFDMQELTLSTSFRCPRSVVCNAHWRVPHMRYPDWAAQGQVTNLDQWSEKDIPDGSAIICRNNAPIFSVAMRLIKKGRGVKILGNDVGAGLIKILEKLGPGDTSSEAAFEAVRLWEDAQMRKAHKARHASIRDKAECLRVFVGQSKTLDEAIAYARTIFSASGPIQLMTGHKSKGGEWPIVFHLDSHLVPSIWALRASEEGDSAQLEQEHNLKYVIETRAQESLYFINSDDYIV